MKKVIFSLLAINIFFLLTNNHLQAQNDKFNKFVASFKESKMPATIQSADVEKKAIDQQLAWEFSWQKNQFQKPEESFVLPFGYYKINANTAVIINAVTAKIEENSTYSLNIQTYNIKKGKLIAEQGGTLGALVIISNLLVKWK